ncbi:MAG: response regulator transcription factor [Bryobacteraceae bacterium]|nr:response regulator transcription factor [Bryobacteraceae bacterium]
MEQAIQQDVQTVAALAEGVYRARNGAGGTREADHPGKVTVAVCETQPVTAAGLASILAGSDGFRLSRMVSSLGQAEELLAGGESPAILIVDKTFGVQVVMDWMMGRGGAGRAAVVIWGVSISEAEALRFLQAGAKGIIRKTADAESLLACLRAVAAGSSWMEDSLFREGARAEKSHRSELTPREQQVMELVEQGFKNKDIARHLGIRPGTVKIHLKHIFEKTGVRGRYGLALSGMKDKGLLALP